MQIKGWVILKGDKPVNKSTVVEVFLKRKDALHAVNFGFGVHNIKAITLTI